MKICWVTPFVLRSSIGRVSAAVTAALAARGHAVEIMRCEDVEDPSEPLHPSRLPVRHWRTIDLKRLRDDCDVVIVNIGDNYPFHAGALAILDAAPCLGIFHDFYIYNLFSGWLHHNGLDYRRHDAEIVATYGPEAEANAVAVRSGQMLDMGEIAAKLPMTEWLARRCEAALAHARFYAPRLEAACAGPLAVTPLCCPDRATPPGPPKAKDRLTITTVGVMNPNKRVADVIRAIGGSDALRTCVYRLVGPISDDEITILAQSRNIARVKPTILGQCTLLCLEVGIHDPKTSNLKAPLRLPIPRNSQAISIHNPELDAIGRPALAQAQLCLFLSGKTLMLGQRLVDGA